LDSLYGAKIGEAMVLQLTEANLTKEANEYGAYSAVKEAVLYGRPFNEIEVEACEVFSDKIEKVASIMDSIHARLSKDTAIDTRLLKRAHVEELNPYRVNLENDIIKALTSIVK
jgi:hypothetical protein